MKHFSKEHLRNLSVSHIGIFPSLETRKKLSQAYMRRFRLYGVSKETRQKISEAAKKRTGEKSGMYGKHHSNETKQKLSDAKKGEKSPYYGKNGKDHPMSKPILQYTLKGVFLKEWESATQVKKVLGFCNTSIGKCAQEKISTSYGYIWKFKETESKKAK